MEDDLAAIDAFDPDLAIGTTPVVQHAKEQGRPGLYFTNLVSARPLMGAAGAGSLAQVINAAISNRKRMANLKGFLKELALKIPQVFGKVVQIFAQTFRAQHQKN